MNQPDSNDYASLFLTDTPFIDLRAPLEFAKGAFPTSTSLPLMDDRERAKVGTCYKQNGQAAAIKLGHRLVSGETKAKRLAAWCDFARQHPDGYLYCWRGGLRSQTVQQWLSEAGCEYPRVYGGYKAMRRFLIEQQAKILDTLPMIILAGRTGCAKTELLKTLTHYIDLEGIAHHRGSSFGKRPEGQPAQLDFENRLAIALLRQYQQNTNCALVIEDESSLIGRCALPHEWRQKMEKLPLVVIDATLEERVEHSFHNYILNKLEEWRLNVGEAQAFAAFSQDICQALDNIRKRLGGLRHQHLMTLMQQALDAHQRGNPDLHRAWITILLTDYYDPMYDHQLKLKNERIIFRGSRKAVYDYLNSLSSKETHIYEYR